MSRKRQSCLQDGRVLEKMRAQHSGKMERHETLIIDHNAWHELNFLATVALKQKAIRAHVGVEQKLF
jgi:hypothetical protein